MFEVEVDSEFASFRHWILFRMTARTMFPVYSYNAALALPEDERRH